MQGSPEASPLSKRPRVTGGGGGGGARSTAQEDDGAAAAREDAHHHRPNSPNPANPELREFWKALNSDEQGGE